MKNVYVIIWVINSFIGTGLLFYDLQEDENNFIPANKHENVRTCFSGQRFQHHSRAFFDFDFEYLLADTDKSIQPPIPENTIKIYDFIFNPQPSLLPHFYDLPPPKSMV